MADQRATGDGGDHYFFEPPAVLERNIAVGVRLISGAFVSFYGAFLFAYIYLRERDGHAAWRPDSVKPPIGSGVAVLACILASVAVTAWAIQLLRRRGESAWRRAALVSQLLTLAALAIQCDQWAALGFGPGSGAYASVFVAWTGFFAAVALLPGLYWRQASLSTSLRHRRSVATGVVAVAGMPGGEGASRLRLGAEAGALALYWGCVAGAEVVMFVLLYLVK